VLNRKVSVYLYATFHTQDRCNTFDQKHRPEIG